MLHMPIFLHDAQRRHADDVVGGGGDFDFRFVELLQDFAA